MAQAGPDLGPIMTSQRGRNLTAKIGSRFGRKQITLFGAWPGGLHLLRQLLAGLRQLAGRVRLFGRTRLLDEVTIRCDAGLKVFPELRIIRRWPRASCPRPAH